MTWWMIVYIFVGLIMFGLELGRADERRGWPVLGWAFLNMLLWPIAVPIGMGLAWGRMSGNKHD